MKNLGKSLVVSTIVVFTFLPGAKPAFAKTGLRFSRHSISFGKVRFEGMGEASTSQPQSFSISNSGSAITGLAFHFAGNDPADFQISSSNCSTGLGADAICQVAVTFTPTRSQKRVAVLIVAYEGNSDAAMLKVSGIAVQTRQVITPPEVDFGKVQVGQTSMPKTITIKNPNGVTVDIQSLNTNGPFAVAEKTCHSSLAAGKSCNITLTFTPNIACNLGPQTGALSVMTDAAITPAQTKLTGTAISTMQSALFVTNFYSNALSIFPATGTDNLMPISTIGSPLNLSDPRGIAVDSNGRLYAANSLFSAINVYSSCGNGTIAPIATIAGDKTGLAGPLSVALDSSGNIYVVNESGAGGFDLGSMTVYPALGSNTGILNEAPTVTITGLNTGLSFPIGLALDSKKNIYVTNCSACGGGGSDRIMVFSPVGGNTGILNEAPIATIVGTNTGLSSPLYLALDSAQRIYVTNCTSCSGGTGSTVTVYPPLGNNIGTLNETPTATLSGTQTRLGGQNAITIDSEGNIYVTDAFAGSAGSVLVYPPLGTSSGTLNETPLATIEGAQTGLDSPIGISLDSSANIYVVNLVGGPSETGNVTVYSALGGRTGTLNETPQAAFGGNPTGINGPVGVAQDSKGNYYLLDGGSGSITVYPGGSIGNVTPSVTIPNVTTSSPGFEGIALDAGDSIYVTNQIGGPDLLGSVSVYAPLKGSTGILTEMPTVVITGSNTELEAPADIALDARGFLYVLNLGGSITIYPPIDGSSGTLDEAPTATIAGASTMLNSPTSLALDSNGRIYVANSPQGSCSITVYAPLGSSTGNLDEAPIITIEGPNTGLNFVDGITLIAGVAVDSEDNIYVSNWNEDSPNESSLRVFAAGAEGNVSPVGVTLSNSVSTRFGSIAIGQFIP